MNRPQFTAEAALSRKSVFYAAGSPTANDTSAVQLATSEVFHPEDNLTATHTFSIPRYNCLKKVCVRSVVVGHSTLCLQTRWVASHC